MTTHLLSKVIHLKGVYHNVEENEYQKFSVTLDRSARNKNDMIKNYEKAFEIFEDLDNKEKCPVI